MLVTACCCPTQVRAEIGAVEPSLYAGLMNMGRKKADEWMNERTNDV